MDVAGWIMLIAMVGFGLFKIIEIASDSPEFKGCLMVMLKLFGFIAGIVGLCLILVYAKGLGLLLLVGIVAAIIFFVVKRLQRQATMESALRKSGCLSISDKDVITVHKRAPILGQCLSIQEYTYHPKHYRAAEQYYVGATVGGIHMGGFHEHPEEELDGQMVRSGKYVLTLVTHNITPTCFVLSDALLKQAKADPFISTLLDGNKLMMLRRIEDAYYLVQDALRTSATTLYDKTVFDNYVEQNVVNSLLTQSDCERILNWLSGK